MAKPRAVRQAAEAADALIASQSETAEPTTVGDDGVADTAHLSVVENQPPAEQTPPETTNEPPADTVEGLRGQLEKVSYERDQMEERWRALDGMLRTTNQKLEGLRAIIANSQAQGEQPGDAGTPEATSQGAAPPPKADVSLPEGTYGAADEDRFGADLCEFVVKQIHAVVGPAVKDLARQMEGMGASVENTSKVVALSQQDRFEAQLDKLVPKWRRIDADPKFIEWLQGDPLYGPAFQKAVHELDGAAAARVFDAYVREAGDPEAEAEAAEARRKRELEQQVAPDTSRGDTTAARPAGEGQPKVWKMSEIRAVYADIQRPKGQRKYTPEQFDALERDIAAAQAEGRVEYD